MTAPHMIAETGDPAVLQSINEMRAWFLSMGQHGHEIGCTFFRYTVENDGRGLLIEGWLARPMDQGPHRWSGSRARARWAHDIASAAARARACRNPA